LRLHSRRIFRGEVTNAESERDGDLVCHAACVLVKCFLNLEEGTRLRGKESQVFILLSWLKHFNFARLETNGSTRTKTREARNDWIWLVSGPSTHKDSNIYSLSNSFSHKLCPKVRRVYAPCFQISRSVVRFILHKLTIELGDDFEASPPWVMIGSRTEHPAILQLFISR
jgi:hypothetical protein